MTIHSKPSTNVRGSIVQILTELQNNKGVVRQSIIYMSTQCPDLRPPDIHRWVEFENHKHDLDYLLEVDLFWRTLIDDLKYEPGVLEESLISKDVH
jgi:hypothetical protein